MVRLPEALVVRNRPEAVARIRAALAG